MYAVAEVLMALTCVRVQYFTGGSRETGRTVTLTRGLIHSLHPESLVLTGDGATGYNRNSRAIYTSYNRKYVKYINT